jgi:hypothetical protein
MLRSLSDSDFWPAAASPAASLAASPAASLASSPAASLSDCSASSQPPLYLSAMAHVYAINQTCTEHGTVRLRVHFAFARASSSFRPNPPSQSVCNNHFVRASFFDDDTVHLARVSLLEPSPASQDAIHAVAEAHVASHSGGLGRTRGLTMFAALEWLHWRERNDYGKCFCWPPYSELPTARVPQQCAGQGADKSLNLFEDTVHIELQACAPLLADDKPRKPICASVLQLTSGYFHAQSADRAWISAQSGTLGPEASRFRTVWNATVDGPIEWRPLACTMRHVRNEREARQAVANQTLIFIGDSTTVELFMVLSEFLQHGFWSAKHNAAYHKVALSLLLRPDVGMRLFDTDEATDLARKHNIRLRLLWNAHENFGAGMLGLPVFRRQSWLALLANYTRAEGSGRRTIFIGSGLHDMGDANWTLAKYERDAEYAIRYLLGLGIKVFWMSAPLKYRSFSCGHAGSPAVRRMNAVAQRVIERFAHEPVPPEFFDLNFLRDFSPFEGACSQVAHLCNRQGALTLAGNAGDGHHGVVHYGYPFVSDVQTAFATQSTWSLAKLVPPPDHHVQKLYGAASAWRVQALFHVLSSFSY